MRHYIVTLLKDLPDVRAGFSMEISEECLQNPFYRNFSPAEKTVLQYKDHTAWVSIEPDLSKMVPLMCLACGHKGLFTCSFGEEKKYDDDITRYYETVGLDCPNCSNKIKTHLVYKGYELDGRWHLA